MRQVFVDAAYWIAQFDSRDQLHLEALETEAQLTGIKLITSELVLIEFLNFFSKGGRQTREEVSGAVQDILEDPNIQIT